MIVIIKAEERHIPDICKLWLEFMRFSHDIDPIFATRDGALPGFEKEYLGRRCKIKMVLSWWLWTGRKQSPIPIHKYKSRRA